MIDKFKPMGEIKGDKNIANQKPKANPKYNHVSKTLNTGTTIKDVIEISNKQLTKQKNEHYHRIKQSTLKDLLVKDEETENIYHMQEKDLDGLSQFDNMSITTTQTNQTNITQASECTVLKNIVKAEQELGTNVENSHFLLLDGRIETEYAEYRITEAHNFPQYKLKQDKFTAKILEFKNKKDKIVIVYGLDEKEGMPIANLFFEKGFDNIYLLGGGIEKFAEKFPGLIEGAIPLHIKKQILKNERKNEKLINAKVVTRQDKNQNDLQKQKQKVDYGKKNKEQIKQKSQFNELQSEANKSKVMTQEESKR